MTIVTDDLWVWNIQPEQHQINTHFSIDGEFQFPTSLISTVLRLSPDFLHQDEPQADTEPPSESGPIEM